MSAFPRGSEWRKWDLHLHAPGGRLNDGYDASEAGWDRYCEVLAESDVVVFGIADYFSLGRFFTCVNEFTKRYPNHSKVFFPNLELRLNEAVNREIQEIDVHLILRPDLDEETAARLLRELKTEVTDPDSQRRLSCADLKTATHFESATVTRQNLEEALKNTFGTAKPIVEHALCVVPSNNNGIRASSGQKRKAVLADAVDRMAHAIFGSDGNTDHFLDTTRSEDEAVAVPKPVFSGCDAHTIDQLEQWLGREVSGSANHKTVTWIKADPTFEGLLQTLAEPRARVRIQATRPDPKEPYKYLSSVNFSGTSDFPDQILLNQNLVSIIGSRSTGKSALLAYIAHAVDPDYTEARQLEAQAAATAATIGPAPGKTWAEVADIECTVEWGEPGTTSGRIIYVPQNALYAISERPEEITAKIRPTLYRLDSSFEVAYEEMATQIQAPNERVRGAVAAWYRLSAAIDTARADLRDIGDRDGIERTRNELDEKIAALRAASSLSKEESDTYQRLVDELGEIAAELKALDAEAQRLAPHLDAIADGKYRIKESVGVDIRVTPASLDLPDQLHQAVTQLIEVAQGSLLNDVRKAMTAFQVRLDSESEKLRERDAALRSKNDGLINI